MAAKNNIWVETAENYKCTIAEAMTNRDWPLSRAECIAEFTEAAGREPTEEEIETMQPDGELSISDFIDQQRYEQSLYC